MIMCNLHSSSYRCYHLFLGRLITPKIHNKCLTILFTHSWRSGLSITFSFRNSPRQKWFVSWIIVMWQVAFSAFCEELRKRISQKVHSKSIMMYNKSKIFIQMSFCLLKYDAMLCLICCLHLKYTFHSRCLLIGPL